MTKVNLIHNHQPLFQNDMQHGCGICERLEPPCGYLSVGLVEQLQQRVHGQAQPAAGPQGGLLPRRVELGLGHQQALTQQLGQL